MSRTSTADPRRGSGRRGWPPGRGANVVSATVNLVILWVLNERPGWEQIPFLTEDTALVLPVVNLSLWASVVLEVLSFVLRSAPLRAAGEAVTTAIALVASVRIWQVFPFDLGTSWAFAVRVLLVVAIVGSAVAVVVAIVRLVGGAVGAPRQRAG